MAKSKCGKHTSRRWRPHLIRPRAACCVCVLDGAVRIWRRSALSEVRVRGRAGVSTFKNV
eukprot:7386941-Prymnesium_polylepis.1